MSIKRAFVDTIIAEKDTITIQGVYLADNGDAANFAVHFLQPFQPVPELISDPPQVYAPLDVQEQGRFTLTVDRNQNGRDQIYCQCVVGIRSENQPTTVFPGIRYVNKTGDISRYSYPYPTAQTIKGLQVRDVEDALKLGVGHAALNLNLPNIARPAPGDTTITYAMDGQDFYFDATYLERFDHEVRSLSDSGIVVTLILLNSVEWDSVTIHADMHEVLLHPDYDAGESTRFFSTESGPDDKTDVLDKDAFGFISAFNVLTEQGLAHYRAFVEFVAERYTRPDQKYGRACGYIIGNEVDAQWVWCNAGEKDVEAYVREHGIAMRTAFCAARKQYAEARVYLSLTHHWGSSWEMEGVANPLRSYAGRDVVEKLNALYQTEGDWDWSMAYHPYPDNLFHADFWNDTTAEASFDTPKITFKNLQILTQYFNQPHLFYDGRQRHIILSEQGFHSDENEEGERLQAAAYAFAYWKVEQEPGIESFILHAHIDNRDEFNLNLGIRRRDKTSDLPSEPGSPKLAYEVFRDIDGPRHDEIMEQAKIIVGVENWK
ncbi:MAG: hypothetical protein GY762_03080 [Proteobacteria bacterium]|nr:hypothetical protein [Pseudomonadota bacterium]